MSAARTAAEWVAVGVGTAAADLTWWRVAQREHYEPGRNTAMLRMWATRTPVSVVPYAVGAVCAAGAFRYPVLGIPAALAVAAAPTGLVFRKPFPRPAFTQRLRRLAGGTVAVQVAAAVAFRSPAVSAALVLVTAPVTDGVLAALKPLEAKLGGKFVTSARARLTQVSPDVVAITGSYGKTSTKAYVEALLAPEKSVFASPASFNNMMGLSRSINDGLSGSTEVFVAEMGTYGPGEIRRLTETFPPRIAAITTIGEAHLERMGSRAAIVTAKLEITERAEIVVLNVDVPELAEAADRLQGSKTVVRVSTRPDTVADVRVVPDGGGWVLTDEGRGTTRIAQPPGGGHPVNLAIATGIARVLGVSWASIEATVARKLPGVAHRAEASVNEAGIHVIDDTYNANPDGAAQALALARSLGEGHRIWVVTPGMVELGSSQDQRNREFAEAIMATPGATLVVVGGTNRRPLVAGATPDRTVLVGSRQAAMAHISGKAEPGDVVLFENDLPDHYP